MSVYCSRFRGEDEGVQRLAEHHQLDAMLLTCGMVMVRVCSAAKRVPTKGIGSEERDRKPYAAQQVRSVRIRRARSACG